MSSPGWLILPSRLPENVHNRSTTTSTEIKSLHVKITICASKRVWCTAWTFCIWNIFLWLCSCLISWCSPRLALLCFAFLTRPAPLPPSWWFAQRHLMIYCFGQRDSIVESTALMPSPWHVLVIIYRARGSFRNRSQSQTLSLLCCRVFCMFLYTWK